MGTIECQVCSKKVDLASVSANDRSLRLYCSRACAGRARGTFYSRSTTKETYRSQPNKHEDGRYSSCLRCEDYLDYTYNTLFCSTTCRDVFWSEYDNWVKIQKAEQRPVRIPKEKTKTKQCPHCSTMIWPQSETCRKHRPQSVYLGRRTRGASTDPDKYIEDWLDGKIAGNQGPKTPCVVHPLIREYLYKESNYACTQCSFKAVHPVDGRPILNLNHIDGNASNHSPDNLEVLCPNCHAMTPNYGNRNKNSARAKNVEVEIRLN